LVLLRPQWILILLTAVGFLTLYALIAKAEEKCLSLKHGKEYAEYRRRVSPLFPRRFEGPLFAGFKLNWALGEYQTWVVVGLLYLLAFLRLCFIPSCSFLAKG
jgi:hypothetical protein